MKSRAEPSAREIEASHVYLRRPGMVLFSRPDEIQTGTKPVTGFRTVVGIDPAERSDRDRAPPRGTFPSARETAARRGGFRCGLHFTLRCAKPNHADASARSKYS